MQLDLMTTGQPGRSTLEMILALPVEQGAKLLDDVYKGSVQVEIGNNER